MGRKKLRKKTKTKPAVKVIRQNDSFSWLPIDTRVIPQIFAFGQVKGIARLFLEIEIILSLFVVMGTLFLLFVHLTIR